MKYINKIPEADKQVSENLMSEGWIKLKAQSNLLKAILLSIPFMIINTIIILIIVYFLYSPLREFLNNPVIDIRISSTFTSLMYIVIFLMFIFLHELLHALLIQDVFKSDKTYWGTDGVSAFVYTTEVIKKSRYLLITITPFIILSIILSFISDALGLLRPFTAF